MRGERGSGSLLAVAVIAAIIAVVSLLVPLAVALSASGQVWAAADASALAAADVAKLAGCSVDGAVVTVRVELAVLGLEAHGRATAGPPGSHAATADR